MAVPPLKSPVGQPIHPFGWIRPSGNHEFRITQTFAQINPQISKLPHHAIDIGNGRLGDPVFACADGRVIAEGWVGLPWSDPSPLLKRLTWGPTYGGIMAVIDHGNGWVTAYAHMARTIINKGQVLKAGDQVGNIGDTGAAKGAGHLHLDVYHNNVKVDPWPLLEQNYSIPPDTAIEEPMVYVREVGYATPRAISCLPGGAIRAYKAPDHTVVRQVTLTRPSMFHARAEAFVTGWSEDPKNPVYEYWVADDGYFGPDNNNGTPLLVAKSALTVPDPLPVAPSQADYTAAVDAAVKPFADALNQANARITGIRASAEPVPVPK